VKRTVEGVWWCGDISSLMEVWKGGVQEGQGCARASCLLCSCLLSCPPPSRGLSVAVPETTIIASTSTHKGKEREKAGRRETWQRRVEMNESKQ